MKLSKLFAVGAIALAHTVTQGQILVENVETPEQLVEDLLVGSGVIVSNIQFNHSIPLAGDVQPMVGYFDASGTTFPITQGLLLATGNVALGVGPNDDDEGTDGTAVPEEYGELGDFDEPDLTEIGTEEIFHEAVLEFDFIPEGDSIFLNYVFASEEYLEYVDAGYNDVFGFFISGPGFSGPFEDGGVNIALVPGTDIPVAIDNINDGDFPELYVDNDGGPDVQYDGYTITLRAKAAVICGETYHIKIAIGDAGDDIVDSGVFLEAGSFSSNTVSVEIASVLGEDAIAEGCDSALVSFVRPAEGDSVEMLVPYVIGGTAINGVDYDLIDDEVLFEVGEDTVTFWIVPIDDGIAEGPETVIIYVDIINDCGDTISTEATIEIIDSSPYELTLSDTLIHCAEDSLLISFEILEGGVPEFDITWSTGDDDFDAWVPGDIVGTTTYTIDVIDACGTIAAGEINVTLDPLDPPTIVFDSDLYTICLGDDLTIDATVTPDDPDMTFEWEPTSAITEDLTTTPAADGWYVLTANDGCNINSDSVFVDVIVVEVEETVGNEVCAGDCQGSIVLVADGGTAPYTFSIDDCATMAAEGNFEALCAGDYLICVQDADGCQYTNTVTVEEGLEPADATITHPGVFCLNDEAEGLVVATAGGDFTGAGMTGSTFNPVTAGVGIHEVIYTIADPCGDADTILIEVKPLPTVAFVGDTLAGCVAHEVSFTNTGDGGATCLWDFGDGSHSSFCGEVNHLYNNPGVYDVTLTITDGDGCSNATTINDYITVYELPHASFVWNPHPASTLDAEVEFTDLSFAADSWTWDFAGLGGSNDQNPIHNFPAEAGDYPVTLWVETAHGCKDSITKNIPIKEPVLVYVPNVFTPDGDDFNEVFLPYLSGIDIYDYHLTIFNRWGEIMFESYDLNVGWTGVYGNGLVQNGVYIWTIEVGDILTDERLEYGGHVTVLK